MKRLLLVILAGAVWFLGLTACTSTPPPSVEAACSAATLEKTNFDTAVREGDRKRLASLNITDENKDATKIALDERVKAACNQPASDPNAALNAQAKEICNNDTDLSNEGTVADCKKRGNTAFEAIPANKRGDEKKPNDPVSVHKALNGLPDKPESLRDAMGFAGQLVKLDQFLKEGASVDTAATAAALYDIFHPDTNRSDVNVGSVGEHRVDWALNAQEERGSGSFTKKTLKTQADIQEFLNGDSGESREARDGVVKAIRDAGYGDNEVARALRGEGYIPVQLKGASQILGTTYYQNGKMLVLGKWRQAAEGDVYWLYFASDGKLIRDALLRADCGNAKATMIRVVRPGTPPAPPVDQPPGEEKCPPGTIIDGESGLCGKPPPGCTEPNNCKPIVTCPPDKPHGKPPVCKDNDGNLPTQGPGPGTNIDPGQGAVVPTTHAPATSRTNPVVTTTKPAPPPVVQPTVVPTQSTVQPSTQPTNTGVLPGEGCDNQEVC